jgi:hypothetical protein
MNKKAVIGIVISLFGVALMGFEMGKSLKIEESCQALHYVGLFMVFIGAFTVVSFNKKKIDK